MPYLRQQRPAGRPRYSASRELQKFIDSVSREPTSTTNFLVVLNLKIQQRDQVSRCAWSPACRRRGNTDAGLGLLS